MKAKARTIDAVVFDVDGVLTRGDITLGPGGEWKTFNVQDGHGFVLARHGGLRTALLSARSAEVVERRAAELKVDVLLQGQVDKAAGLRAIASRLGLDLAAICFVGDDLVDLPAMGLAGLSVAVANAVPEVRAAADEVTRRRGGEGAAREVIERLLKARGVWHKVLAKYAGSAPASRRKQGTKGSP